MTSSCKLAIHLLIWLLSLSSESIASASTKHVALSDADLQELKLVALATFPDKISLNPEIMSSTYAYRWAETDDETIHAVVKFKPYSTSRGVAEGHVLFCEKPSLTEAWACPKGQIRRYVDMPGHGTPLEVTGLMDQDYLRAVLTYVGELRATDDALQIGPKARVRRIEYFSPKGIRVWYGPGEDGSWRKIMMRVLNDSRGEERFEVDQVVRWGS